MAFPAPRARARARARDADRTATCDLLDVAFGEGQIDGMEHRTRTAAALAAVTVDELRAVTADLQSGPAAPAGPATATAPAARLAPGHGPPLRIVLGAMATGAYLVVALPMWFGHDDAVPVASGPGRSVVAPDHVPDAAQAHPVSPRTPQGFSRMVADIDAELGTTRVDELSLGSSTTAVVTAPDALDPSTQLVYHYDGGLGLPERRARDPRTATVDLATIEVEPVLGLLADAPRSLGVPGATGAELVVLGLTSGPRVVIAAVDRQGAVGTLTALPDGTVVDRDPYRPG